MRRARRQRDEDPSNVAARIEADSVRASRWNVANTVIQGAILCVMVYGAISVERLTARHFQWQRAATFIERLNSDQIIRARATFDNWRKTGETLEDLIARSVDRARGKADSEKSASEHVESERAGIAARIEQDLRVFVNFFQELAVAMKYGTLDELYTYDSFGAVVTRYAEEMRPYIEEVRAIRKRPRLYEDIFTMAARMRSLDRTYANLEASH
jgi:Domain of unknown function (DUF4760)